MKLLSRSAMLEGDVWTLFAAQLILTRNLGLVESLPNISGNELADKSDSSILLKLLAILHVSWMIVQMISRAVQHQASTPLEVMTIAFAACASLIYLLSLDRPQGVETPVYTKSARFATRSDIERLLATELLPIDINIFKHNSADNVSFHNLCFGLQLVDKPRFLVRSSAAAALFGRLRLLAYDFAYPSEIERLLLKGSAIGTMVVPALLALFTWCGSERPGTWRVLRFVRWLCQFLAFVSLLLLLLLARIFLLVEISRSLYFLPADAYRSTWASNIPHVG